MANPLRLMRRRRDSPLRGREPQAGDLLAALLAAAPQYSNTIRFLHAAMPLQNGATVPDDAGFAKSVNCCYKSESVTIKPILWGCNKLLASEPSNRELEQITLRLLKTVDGREETRRWKLSDLSVLEQ